MLGMESQEKNTDTTLATPKGFNEWQATRMQGRIHFTHT